MRKSRIFFKVSDIIFHYPRNYKKYPDVLRKNDFSYDKRFGKYTKGDIYYNPQKKQGKYPVFLNVHGGGFVRGDKRHRSTFAASLADRGWFVFNINHRLAPEYPLPSGIEDTLNALIYLNKIADEYDLDLSRIVISGDSAGAYYALAAVAATYSKEMRNALSLPEYNGKIAALVTFCGLYDIKSALFKKSPLGMAKDIAECLMGIKINADFSNTNEFENLEYIAPLNYINNQWPETYIIKAVNDAFCGGQGELLEEKLQQAGVQVEMYFANKYKEDHCFHLLPYLKSTKECMEHVNKYLDKFINI